MRDDVPLPRAGILRLVDQHMIDAAVELVMHPAGGAAIQHRQRLVDQIVVVEQAAFLLLAPVIRRRRGRDLQQRLVRSRVVTARRRSISGPMRRLSDSNSRAIAGLLSAEFLGHHRFARRALVGEEHAEIVVDLRGSGRRQRLAQPRRLVLVGLAAGIENGGDLVPSRSRQIRPVDDLALDVFDAVIGDRRQARRPSARRRHRRCRRRRSTP